MMLPEPANSAWSSNATGQQARAFAQALERRARAPGLAHHIHAPVVGRIQRPLDQLHRTGIEIQLAVGEAEAQARRGVLAFVDAVAAEQQQVDAHGDILQLDQQMLAPAAEFTHHLAGQPCLVDLGTAFGALDALTGECRDFLAENDDGWTFGHGCTS